MNCIHGIQREFPPSGGRAVLSLACLCSCHLCPLCSQPSLEHLDLWIRSLCVGAVHYLSAFCSWWILCHVSGHGRASSCLFFTQEEFFLLTLLFFLLKNHQPSRNPLFLAVASCGILSTISLYLLHFLQPIASILFISLSFCEDCYPWGFSVIPALLLLFSLGVWWAAHNSWVFISVWGCSCTPALLPSAPVLPWAPCLPCKCANPTVAFLWGHPCPAAIPTPPFAGVYV